MARVPAKLLGVFALVVVATSGCYATVRPVHHQPAPVYYTAQPYNRGYVRYGYARPAVVVQPAPVVVQPTVVYQRRPVHRQRAVETRGRGGWGVQSRGNGGNRGAVEVRGR